MIYNTKPKYISLKKNCSNRYLTLNSSTLLQDVFTIQDFNSSHFVENFIKSNTELVLQSPISFNCIQSCINKINSEFQTIKQHLEKTQIRLVQQATAFLSGSTQEQEANTVKYELKKCHEKIQNNPEDSSLIEDFCRLLNRHKRICHDIDTVDIQERTNKISDLLGLLTNDIQLIIDKYSSRWLNDLYSNMNTERSVDKCQDRTFNAILKLVREENLIKQKFLYKRNNDNFLFLQTQRNGEKSTKLTSLNLHTKKLQFSTRYTQSSVEVINYLQSLNAFVTQLLRADELIVCRITSKGVEKLLKLSSNLKLKHNIMNENYINNYPGRFGDILKQLSAVVFIKSSYIRIIDIPTRRILLEKDFENKIYGVKSSPMSTLLAIIFEDKVSVYSILDGAILLSIRMDIPIDRSKNLLKEVHLYENFILVYEHFIDKEWLIWSGMENNTSAHIFRIYQIDQNRPKKYTITLSTNKYVKSHQEYLDIHEVALLPKKEYFQISYHIFGSPECSTETYCFKNSSLINKIEGCMIWSDDSASVLSIGDQICVEN